MRAAEIMTENPRVVLATSSVSEAVDVLERMDIRHVPVVDDRGHLVGMLSDRDLVPIMRRAREEAEAEHMTVPLSRRPVSDLMSKDVITVTPDTDVGDVMDRMVEARIGAVPVVDGDGGVVGIVSYVDVLRAGGPGSVQ